MKHDTYGWCNFITDRDWGDSWRDPSLCRNTRIRIWAWQNGHPVSTKGIIAKRIRDAYDAAHPNDL